LISLVDFQCLSMSLGLSRSVSISLYLLISFDPPRTFSISLDIF
jgi:hypothetical protein